MSDAFSNLSDTIDALPPVDGLDPGIRRMVTLLRKHRFVTSDSGDGQTKPAAGDGEALQTSHVFIVVPFDVLIKEALRLQYVLHVNGIPRREGQVQANYDPYNNVAILMVLGISDSDLPSTEV